MLSPLPDTECPSRAQSLRKELQELDDVFCKFSWSGMISW